MLAATIAWDNRLSRTYREAIAALEDTMWQVRLKFQPFVDWNEPWSLIGKFALQVSSLVQRLNGTSRCAVVAHHTHVPNKASWDSAVKQALDKIRRKNSSLVKVAHY